MAHQSSSLDLNNAVALLESLCEYVATLSEQFDIFEKNGKAPNGCKLNLNCIADNRCYGNS